MLRVARGVAPVKAHGVAFVPHLERATAVLERKTDDEGAKLVGRPRGVEMGLELTRRPGV